jgi:hypothetical protein
LAILYGENIDYSIESFSTEYCSMLSEFECGNSEIDRYLCNDAKCDTTEGRGVTKLILNDNKSKVIGFYTLDCSAMIVETNESQGKIGLAPAVEIKMFAVDKSYQDISYSKIKEDGTFSDILLCEAINQINNFTESTCGAVCIILYSVPSAKKFYIRNKFVSFKPIMKKNDDVYLKGCEPMYMAL